MQAVVSGISGPGAVPESSGKGLLCDNRLASQLPDYAARISCRENIRGDGPRDNTAGSDNGAIANARAWTNDRTASNPNIRSNGYRLRKLQPGASLRCADRVRGSVDLN